MAHLSPFLFRFCLAVSICVWGYRLIYLAGPWGFEIGQQDLAVRIHWLFVLLGAFMPYLLLIAGALAMVLLAFRRWRWFTFVLVLVLFEVALSYGRTQGAFGFSDKRQDEVSQVSVATFNMQANQRALRAFADLAHGIDVIYLCEVPQAYGGIDFPTLFPGHTLHQAFYSPGYRGSMAVLVRGEGDVRADTGTAGNLRPIFDVHLTRAGQDIRLLASHPLAPFFPRMMAERNHTLNRFHQLLEGGDGLPTILMGDMNTTPFEVDGWRLPGLFIGNPLPHSWSGLDDLGRWRGLARLRIDHIRLLQGRDHKLIPVAGWVGSNLGSDHLPVFAMFQVK